MQLCGHALGAVLQLLRLEVHHRLRLLLHGWVHLAVREKNQLWIITWIKLNLNQITSQRSSDTCMQSVTVTGWQDLTNSVWQMRRSSITSVLPWYHNRNSFKHRTLVCICIYQNIWIHTILPGTIVFEGSAKVVKWGILRLQSFWWGDQCQHQHQALAKDWDHHKQLPHLNQNHEHFYNVVLFWVKPPLLPTFQDAVGDDGKCEWFSRGEWILLELAWWILRLILNVCLEPSPSPHSTIWGHHRHSLVPFCPSSGWRPHTMRGFQTCPPINSSPNVGWGG